MNACKPSLRILPRRAPGAASRGFSAIEVTAVAAIIFTLALILVPIVNKRVDESKRVSAEDDMAAIEKAEQLAFGYTGHYFRLHDLVRPQPDEVEKRPDTNGVTIGLGKVPPAFWNRPASTAERTTLMTQWTGPYLPPFNVQRSLSLAQLGLNRPDLINTNQAGLPTGYTGITPGGGPIFLFVDDGRPYTNGAAGATPDPNSTSAFTTTKYPVDPWGNPYLFFGDGFYGDPASSGQNVAIPATEQISFSTCAIYSLGPDGVAGGLKYYRLASTAPTPIDYFRESPRALGTAATLNPEAALGAGDDLKREF